MLHFVKTLLVSGPSQAEAVGQVVDEVSIAIGEASARQDVVENGLDELVLDIVVLLHLIDKIIFIKFLGTWRNGLYLVKLPKKSTSKESFLEEEHYHEAYVHQRFMEASN